MVFYECSGCLQGCYYGASIMFWVFSQCVSMGLLGCCWCFWQGVAMGLLGCCRCFGRALLGCYRLFPEFCYKISGMFGMFVNAMGLLECSV